MSLRRADHSSRGVLPIVVRRCVWSRNFVNEKAMAHWGLFRHMLKIIYILGEKTGEFIPLLVLKKAIIW